MATLSNSETLYVNVVRPTPEGVGTLLASETAFTSRLEWSRMSDDKGSLVVILLDNGGTVSTTPRRITLPAGRSLYLYAKADTSDAAQTVVAGPFTASGSSVTDYAFTATLDLAIDSALWPDNGILNLSVAFVVEDTADGANASSYPAELVLRRNPLGEGTPNNTTIFLRKALNLSDLASAPTALTNLGGTTVGQAVFTAIDAAAARTAIGAGTGSGDITDNGTVTVANADKVVVVSGLKTIKADVAIAESATASTIAKRDSAGRLFAEAFFSGTLAVTNQVFISKEDITGRNSSGSDTFFFNSGDGSGTLTGTFNVSNIQARTTAGATLKDSAGNTVFTFGVTATNDTFARPVTFEEDVTFEGETQAVAGRFIGTTSLLLGTAGSLVGNIGFANATSGTLTLAPPTGALGTGTVTLPLTGTLATLAGTETLTNKTLATLDVTANSITVNSKVLTAPSASGTLALTTDIPAFATAMQTRAGTSTTLVVSPFTALSAATGQGARVMFTPAQFTEVLSGAGSGTGIRDWGVDVTAPTTASGHAIRRNHLSNNVAICRGKNRGVIAWSKRIVLCGTACVYATLDANCVFRYTFGKNSTDGAGDLPAARRGIGLRIAATGAVQVHVSNGTATTTSSNGSFTPTVGQAFDFAVISDGAGNVTLEINDAQVASTTGGPTTDSASTENALQIEIQNTSTATLQGGVTAGNWGMIIGR